MPRFSLLLLDHGEVLLENALSSARFEGEDAMDGRLFLASHSLFFEPRNESKPLYRFLYKHMGCEPRSSEDTNSFAFRIKKVVEIRKFSPYITVDYAPSSVNILCELKHTRASKLCQLMADLFAAHVARPSEAGEKLLSQILAPRISEPFDRSRVVDFSETVLLPLKPEDTLCVERIGHLVNFFGCLLVSKVRLYFQHCRLNNISGQARQCLHWELSALVAVHKRRYLLRQVGLELVFQENESMWLCFSNQVQRDAVFDLLSSLCTFPVWPKLEEFTRKWQLGQLDNYSYLCKVNEFADRSTRDLAQYPVFPWVIADYDSPTLNLDNPQTFRDLSKPIGALNPERLRVFQTRYNELLLEEDEQVPPFLYGTHFSTPGFVLFYLIRERPEEALRLQNGRFDGPDRMFSSVKQCYQNCLTSSSDVKELIPEFYDVDKKGTFLLNSNRLEFGKRAQDGKRVNDVELPPWALNSPKEFVKQMRAALESEYVSNHLHFWIDLVFGVDQRNILKNNVFYHMTYPPVARLNSPDDNDEVLKKSNEMQVMEFGQMPKQVFFQPHPARSHHFEDVVTNHGDVALELQQHELHVKEEAEEKKDSTTGQEAATRRVWRMDPNSTSHIVSLPPNVSSLDACLTKDDEERAILACSDGSLLFLNTPLLDMNRRVRLSPLALSCCVNFGSELLAGSWDNALYRYSVSTGRTASRIENAHDDAVSAISCLYPTDRFVTGGWDACVKVWQAETMECTQAIYTHKDPIFDVKERDRHSILSSDKQGVLYLHDTRSTCFDPVWTYSNTTSTSKCVQVHWVDHNRILTCFPDLGLFLMDARMNGPEKSVVHRAEAIGWRPTCFTSNDLQAVVGDSTGRITSCGLDKLEQIPFESNVVLRHKSKLVALAASDKYLFSACEQGSVGLTSWRRV